MNKGVIMMAVAGAGVAVALAAKGRSVPAGRSPLVSFKGESVDTSAENVRTGQKLSLEEWAKANGFVLLPPTTTNADPAFANIIRSFISNAEDARREHEAPALFATMKGGGLLGVIVYSPAVNGIFYELWALPP